MIGTAPGPTVSDRYAMMPFTIGVGRPGECQHRGRVGAPLQQPRAVELLRAQAQAASGEARSAWSRVRTVPW